MFVSYTSSKKSYSEVCKNIDITTNLTEFLKYVKTQYKNKNKISSKVIKLGYEKYSLENVNYFKNVDTSTIQDVSDLTIISACFENINKEIIVRYNELNRNIILRSKLYARNITKKLNILLNNCDKLLNIVDTVDTQIFLEKHICFITQDSFKTVVLYMSELFSVMNTVSTSWKNVISGSVGDLDKIVSSFKNSVCLNKINFFINDDTTQLTYFPDYDILKQNVSVLLSPDMNSSTAKSLGWSKTSVIDALKACSKLCELFINSISNFTDTIVKKLIELKSVDSFYGNATTIENSGTLNFKVRYNLCFDLINLYWCFVKTIINQLTLCIDGCLTSLLNIVLKN